MAIVGESSAPKVPLRKRKKGPEFGCALSFQEIADELGCTHQAVQASYKSGILKLRRFHPETLARLRALAAELAISRERRLRGMVDVPHASGVMIGA